MCFWHGDSDWAASVYEDGVEKADKVYKCYECRNRIHPGQNVRKVFMQELQECRKCDRDLREEWDDEYEGGPLPPCDNNVHDFGETMTDYTCLNCVKFLEAVKEVELAEGCAEHASQPNHGELLDALWGADGSQAYIDRARYTRPELAFSGYLDRLYDCTREGREQWGDDSLFAWKFVASEWDDLNGGEG